MADVRVMKDATSLYLLATLDRGQSVVFDWSLPKSWTAVIGRGNVDIGFPGRNFVAMGLCRIAPDEKFAALAKADSTIICPFLINDQIVMDTLLKAETLERLKASTTQIIPVVTTPTRKHTGTLPTSDVKIKTFTLQDLEDEIIKGA